MLSLRAVPVGRHDYYLATVAAGLQPGVRLVEPDGIWSGSISQTLGLSGQIVAPQALEALLAGIDPLQGSVLDHRHDRVRMAAFDCTFSPPKSVSILHALGSDDVSAAVRAAHDASVQATLGYLEREAAAVRRGRAGRERLAAGGLGAASFVHRSSRAADPHLHTHLLVANLAADATGTWSALDGRGLYLHARAASALYSAQLRAELVERLGVGFDPTSPHGDLLGIERRVIVAFSRRSQAIAAELAAARERGGASGRVAAAHTRPPKDYSVSYEELVDSWRARAVVLGIPPGRLDCLLGLHERGTGAVLPATTGSPPAVGRRQLPEPPLGTMGRREVIVWYAGSLAAGAPVGAVVRGTDELVTSGRLVPAGRGRPWLRGRLPGGIEEDRYASPATLALVQRWEAAIAGPTGLTGRLRTLEAPRSPFERAVRLNELVRQEAAAGRRLIGLTSGGARRAAAIEAMTGLRTVQAGSRLPTVGHDALVVEERLVDDRPGLAGQVLSRAEAGAPVIVLRIPGAGASDARQVLDHARLAALSETSDRLQAAERQVVEGVQVVVAASTPELIGALLADARRGAVIQPATSAAPVVVVPDRQLAAAIEAVFAGRVELARSLPGHALSSDVLVLGPARLIGRHRIPDAQRTHYAVLAPCLTAQERLANLLEIAEPAALVARIGHLPARSLDERARWRDAALLALSPRGSGVAERLAGRDLPRPTLRPLERAMPPDWLDRGSGPALGR